MDEYKDFYCRRCGVSVNAPINDNSYLCDTCEEYLAKFPDDE